MRRADLHGAMFYLVVDFLQLNPSAVHRACALVSSYRAPFIPVCSVRYSAIIVSADNSAVSDLGLSGRIAGRSRARALAHSAGHLRAC